MEVKNLEEKYKLWEEEEKQKIDFEFYYMDYKSYKGKIIPKEIEDNYNKIPLHWIIRKELFINPFILDEETGNQKYSDEVILEYWINRQNNLPTILRNKQSNIISISDIRNHLEKRFMREKEFNIYLEKISKSLGLTKKLIIEDIWDMKYKPFNSKYFTKEIDEDVVINYWKNFMSSDDFFVNKDITKETIVDYLNIKSKGWIS
ncbi:hypothetical protein [Aliarcobacter cryaerophilus]|uniref:hypothetical protein n=1 Tax=Aliarcobacter cryaerophilus TaxID=28198 RepID=UPI00112F02AD|nr:hypothetical protein [Aliarcobacter cryaerophilus]